MKVFLKILKIFISSALFLIICVTAFILVFQDKEKRYKLAEHAQGKQLSQSMFELLKFQNPDNYDNYFEQSVAFNKYGYHDKGFELLDQAVDLDPVRHLCYRAYMKLRFLRDFDGAL